MPVENFRGGGRGRGGRGRGGRRPNYWNYGGWGYPGAYPYYFGSYQDQFYYDNLYNYPDTIYVNNLYNPLTNNPPPHLGQGQPTVNPPLSKGESQESKLIDWIKENKLIVIMILLVIGFIMGFLIYKRK